MPSGPPAGRVLGGREVVLRVERRWIEEPVGSTGGERRRMFQVQLEVAAVAAWRRSRMVRGRLRTRRTVVKDPGRVCCRGAVRAEGRHGLWLVVRRLPKPAEAAAGIGLTAHRMTG
jgi:hypothetical protein